MGVLDACVGVGHGGSEIRMGAGAVHSPTMIMSLVSVFLSLYLSSLPLSLSQAQVRRAHMCGYCNKLRRPHFARDLTLPVDK